MNKFGKTIFHGQDILHKHTCVVKLQLPSTSNGIREEVSIKWCFSDKVDPTWRDAESRHLMESAADIYIYDEAALLSQSLHTRTNQSTLAVVPRPSIR